MRAVRVDSDRNLCLTDSAPEPEAAAGDALVKVSRVLLDHLDAVACGLVQVPGLPAHTGTLGHVFCGVVKSLEIPSDAPASVASRRSWGLKRVLVSPSVPCAHCDLCRSGLSAHCRSRQVIGVQGREGGCAQLARVPIASLALVPDNVSDDKAVFAHAVATAVHFGQMLRAESRTYITVLGDSLVALLTAQVLARVNKAVRLLSTRPDRARLCERWGIRHRPVEEAGRRQDQDAVIDCTGTSAGLRLSLQFTRPRGCVLLHSPLGLLPFPAGRPLSDQPPPHYLNPVDWTMAVANEIQILGCREGALPEGLGLLAENTVDVLSLAGGKCRLEQIPAALEALRDPDHLPFLIELESARARAGGNG